MEGRECRLRFSIDWFNFAPILGVTLPRMRGNSRSMKPFLVSLAVAFVATVLAVPALRAAEGKPVSKEVAVIKTSEGDMVIEFWPEVAPQTVASFIKLAKDGFYNGTCFHRIIKGFMIQGGDPLSKDPSKEDLWGSGNADHYLKAEFSDRHHARGVISMARSREPDSASCQFFICLADQKRLDGQYTAFGHLIKGDDVLMKLGDTPVHGSKPVKRAAIESIKIVPAKSIK